MKQIALSAGAATVLGATCLVAFPAAAAPPDNWGQEVKACNQSSCYPAGGSRGSYVTVQAKDGQGPGYAWELDTLAYPGNSDPRLP